MPKALAPSFVEQVWVPVGGGILALGALTRLGLPRSSRVAGGYRLGFVAPMTVAGPRRILTGFPPSNRRVTDSWPLLAVWQSLVKRVPACSKPRAGAKVLIASVQALS